MSERDRLAKNYVDVEQWHDRSAALQSFKAGWDARQATIEELVRATNFISKNQHEAFCPDAFNAGECNCRWGILRAALEKVAK